MASRDDPEISQMGAYRCQFCGDWHISRTVNNVNGPDYLVIDRDPQFMKHEEVMRNRKRRETRVMVERQRQLRQRVLGD